MCARSDAWYAIPENREKRKANMRSYQLALTQLGRRYPDHRRRAYRRARQAGQAAGPARQRALASLRDRHQDEFRLILAGLRAG